MERDDRRMAGGGRQRPAAAAGGAGEGLGSALGFSGLLFWHRGAEEDDACGTPKNGLFWVTNELNGFLSLSSREQNATKLVTNAIYSA